MKIVKTPQYNKSLKKLESLYKDRELNELKAIISSLEKYDGKANIVNSKIFKPYQAKILLNGLIIKTRKVISMRLNDDTIRLLLTCDENDKNTIHLIDISFEHYEDCKTKQYNIKDKQKQKA